MFQSLVPVTRSLSLFRLTDTGRFASGNQGQLRLREAECFDVGEAGGIEQRDNLFASPGMAAHSYYAERT